jgi:ubiquinone/menaquinone biosynthesis C-methylase UbiE
LQLSSKCRAADPQHQAMLQANLTDAAIPQGAHVLEVGCGTGAVTRVQAAWPGVDEAVGIDPSSVLIAKVRELGAGLNALTFKEGDGRALPFADCLFDVPVFGRDLTLGRS